MLKLSPLKFETSYRYSLHNRRWSKVVNKQPISAHHPIVVPFFDVDSLNLVWHGHYPKYLELARCELLDNLGYNYRAMAESGFIFPIVDMRIKYIKPLVFGQKIVITATLEEWQCRLKITYLISDEESREKLTVAHTIQAAVEKASGTMQLHCPAILIQKVNQWSG